MRAVAENGLADRAGSMVVRQCLSGSGVLPAPAMAGAFAARLAGGQAMRVGAHEVLQP